LSLPGRGDHYLSGPLRGRVRMLSGEKIGKELRPRKNCVKDHTMKTENGGMTHFRNPSALIAHRM